LACHSDTGSGYFSCGLSALWISRGGFVFCAIGLFGEPYLIPGGGSLFRGKELWISRAFKIWPSYYFFLFIGNLVVLYVYRDSAIDHSIRGDQWWKFLFFYQNYRGTNHHIFDQVWSLCIEEHFYILLPLGFFLWTRYFRRYPIILFLVLAILGGNLLRVASWLINFETHSATHNRIDALTWGVLLCALERTPYFKSINRPVVFFLGLMAALFAAVVHARFDFIFFEKVVFHGIMPIFIFLILAGSIGFHWKRLHFLRIISYYSFNWYLWHQIFYYRKGEPYGVVLYFIVGFSLAFIATHLVEESGLKLREMWRKSLKKAA